MSHVHLLEDVQKQGVSVRSRPVTFLPVLPTGLVQTGSIRGIDPTIGEVELAVQERGAMLP
jgi:hypothetical protein